MSSARSELMGETLPDRFSAAIGNGGRAADTPAVKLASMDAPGLREPAEGRPLPRGAAIRAQGALFAAAGLVGALGVLLPHPSAFGEVGMLSVQASSLLAAALLLGFRDRIPAPLVAAGPFAATVLTSVALVASGSSITGYLLFYLWVAFYAYFLPRRQAVSLTLFTVLNYVAVVLWFRAAGEPAPPGQSNQDVSAIVLVSGTLVVVGAFVVHLRERVEQLIAQLTQAAATDPLTALLNRRGFHAAIERELVRPEVRTRPFSVLIGDCDHFKRLNDTRGHQAGDEALVTMAVVLEEGKRPGDVAARVGGEEFAVLLPDCDGPTALHVAERLRTGLAEAFARQPIPLTMSFGVASWPAQAATLDELLRVADDALYAAKTLGRNRSVLYSEKVEGILTEGREGAPGRDRVQLATVLNLAEALDLRDTGTALHSQTVGRYSELMARSLGLDREHVERVRLAGVLHDIGKIGVPDSVLMKAGPLTDDEFDLMRKHPELGARILDRTGLDDIRRWILAHHERPDGRGYPHGLAGDDIPLEARILAVADAYEAMTSDRVYRKALGRERAREELAAGAGRQFDATVAQTFLDALESGT
jgi:diguanylate cyclase (GGDEF)-like protein/putative nucleotidyltransferase with HDIG domain